SSARNANAHVSVLSTAPAGIEDPAPEATAIAAARDAAIARPSVGTAGRDRVLVAGDVAAQKHEVGAEQRQQDVQRADPDGADDRCPVGGRPQEAVPRIELGAEQVRAEALGAGEDTEELH